MLVRIFTVEEYGAYREFLLYAGLIAPLVNFGVARALLFLLPKQPDHEKVWVTQTSLFTLAFCLVAVAGIYLAGDLIRANTSFDFVLQLQIYIFVFINFDFVELYWLGKKRTDLVLYYSTGRLLARTLVVVTAAYVTRSAAQVVYWLIVLESLRLVLVFGYALLRRWFTSNLTVNSLRLQMSYFLPLGSGAVFESLNANIGLLFISVMLGPEALAFYAIGALALEIVNLMRGAVADVIFPDIVEMKTARPKDALPLWQKATVWYCVMLFPMVALFSYYADAIIYTLFTADYAAAVPVFALYAISIVVYCFDFHLPLRVQNKNRYFLVGSIVALFSNVAMLYPMYLMFGFAGPVVSVLLSRIAMTVYMAGAALKEYQIGVSQLVHWRRIGKVLTVTLLCMPLLVAGRYLIDSLLIRGVVFGVVFLAAYLCIIQLTGVWDAVSIFRRLFSRLVPGRSA